LRVAIVWPAQTALSLRRKSVAVSENGRRRDPRDRHTAHWETADEAARMRMLNPKYLFQGDSTLVTPDQNRGVCRLIDSNNTRTRFYRLTLFVTIH
jgi:hypothetical protein